MVNTLSKVLIFAAGAVVGSAVTWKIVKTKYERIANDEIERAYETYHNITKTTNTSEETIDEDSEEETEEDKESDMVELRDKLTQLGYADCSNMSNNKGGIKPVTKPRVITPEEFGEEEEYEIVSLDYYTDGVLADEFGNVIENIDETVGCDATNHFGDYPDDPDCVYVKNDELKTVYEILLNADKYSDAYAKHKRQVDNA